MLTIVQKYFCLFFCIVFRFFVSESVAAEKIAGFLIKIIVYLILFAKTMCLNSCSTTNFVKYQLSA